MADKAEKAAFHAAARASLGIEDDGLTTEQRQRRLGVTHYRWRYIKTRGNCGHADREGQVFAWDDPPPGGHPGQAVGCMCWAEGVFPDFDDLRELFEFR